MPVTMQLIYGKDAQEQKWFVDGRGRRWYQKGQILDLTLFLPAAPRDTSGYRLGLFYHSRTNSRGTREVLGTDVQVEGGWRVAGRMASCRLRVMGGAVNSKHNRKVATCLVWGDDGSGAYALSEPFYITSNRTSYSRAQGVVRAPAASGAPPQQQQPTPTAAAAPPGLEPEAVLRIQACTLTLALDGRTGPFARRLLGCRGGEVRGATDGLVATLRELEGSGRRGAVRSARAMVAGFLADAEEGSSTPV